MSNLAIQTSIKQLVPAYTPENDCVLLFEFDDDASSAVIRVTNAVPDKSPHAGIASLEYFICNLLDCL